MLRLSANSISSFVGNVLPLLIDTEKELARDTVVWSSSNPDVVEKTLEKR